MYTGKKRVDFRSKDTRKKYMCQNRIDLSRYVKEKPFDPTVAGIESKSDIEQKTNSPIVAEKHSKRSLESELINIDIRANSPTAKYAKPFEKKS